VIQHKPRQATLTHSFVSATEIGQGNLANQFRFEYNSISGMLPTGVVFGETLAVPNMCTKLHQAILTHPPVATEVGKMVRMKSYFSGVSNMISGTLPSGVVLGQNITAPNPTYHHSKS
jgi:hypothetical protein